jgi:hypothetical protein
MKNLSSRLVDAAVGTGLLLGSIAFASTMSTYVTTKALAQPACDGLPCDASQGCGGSQCVCNAAAGICVHNT